MASNRRQITKSLCITIGPNSVPGRMLASQMKILFPVARVAVPDSVSGRLSTFLLSHHIHRHGSSYSSGRYEYGQNNDEEVLTEVDEMVETLERINSPNRRDRNAFVRDWKSDRIRVKTGMIKKKYFQLAQETSLLTWTAKEQICFLHDQDPEIWSVQRLADSFPVSEEGILKILKSTYKPRTEKELRNHDERVRKRWHAVKRLTGTQGGPVQTESRQIIDEQKLPLMINAAGMKDSPGPKSQFLPNRTVTKSAGIFESIIIDYAEQVEKKEINSVETSQFDADNRHSREDDDDKLLRAIVQSNVSKARTDQKRESGAGISAGRVFDVSDDIPEIQKTKPTRRERRLSSQKDRLPCVVDATNLETYQLQDTGKRSNNRNENQN